MIRERWPEFEKRGYELVMAVAPTKNTDRFEWFAEKATEIGVDRIVPLLTDHCERRTLKTCLLYTSSGNRSHARNHHEEQF